ncbi:MAG TPA: phosphoribosylformylglycinamidine synthase subunit PurL [Candidatus Methanoperedenaceae archaeon]|nr:phosphoribosylformylglycinamidine synthase subunit PurL [Candidatus Methanoperedenaceae archaeon]
MLPEADFKEIQRQLGREPNPVEQVCFLNLWSEHCSYRSSGTLLKTFTTTGDRVIIGPGDDSAVIRLEDGQALTLSMESHNHPSYVDPYNGAATGVGGIVRDVLSMGARPIALLDPLYFGPLTSHKNRYLFEEVVKGIAGYGNCIGVPVVGGEVFFDECYSGNPLVNVACVGLQPEDKIITAVAKRPGDHLIVMGSSTGRDGLGGASFASRDLAEESEAEDRGHVQIGDPFTEKLLIEATLEACEQGYVLACRDLGAAGLVGSSSEMAAKGELGAHIYADRLHLREPGMNPMEIMVSESQERMLFEVAPGNVEKVLKLAEKYDLKASDIGYLTGDKRYVVEFQGKIVADMPVMLLAFGAPKFAREERAQVKVASRLPPMPDIRKMLLDLMASPNIASKEWVYRQYDHEVQIRTVVKPGKDAAVLRILDDTKGIALSCGCNPGHGSLDPYSAGAGAVLENAMNIATVGGESLAILDCLNFGNPETPENFHKLKQSVLGVGDMARALGVPVVGGNVSLYNDSAEFNTTIAPTPSVALAGWVDDLSRVPAMAPRDGDAIILVGDTRDELGGSEYYALSGGSGNAPVPPKNAAELVDRLVECARTGKVSLAHDVSRGGLAVALCEVLDCGAEVDVSKIQLRTDLAMFSESYGRMLLVTPEPEAIRKRLGRLPNAVIGHAGGGDVVFRTKEGKVVLAQGEIREALSSLTRMMMG